MDRPTRQPEIAVAPDADRDAVVATIEDYFLGWYDGDADRMTRALHPELAKRSHVGPAGRPRSIEGCSAADMIGWTGEGRGRRTDPGQRRFEVMIDEIHGTIATARVHAVPFVEYLQLARTPAGWRIVNTLWQEP